MSDAPDGSAREPVGAMPGAARGGARRAALLSVSDKRGVERLARALAGAGFELLSTGGTAARLREAGLAVTDVAEHTGAPEMMDGRVKTLHPRVHGGILGRRGTDDAVMAERGIVPIDWVAVNLYPFEATVARAGASFDEAVENIDVGGPAMVRAAAKNHASVAVLTDPDDYDEAIALLERGAGGGGGEGGDADAARLDALRLRLAVKAFAHTARYDAAVAAHFAPFVAPADDGRGAGAPRGDGAGAGPEPFPATFRPTFERVATLRYGENPHQRAAFYRTARAPDANGEGNGPDGTLARARVVQGKPLSYNNLADADAALACVRGLEGPGCTIVKHANPCGAAVAPDLGAAYDRAFATDPTSAFGGIVAFNRTLDGGAARALLERQFVEVVVAPGYADAALEALAAKPNVRVLDVGALGAVASEPVLHRVSGGLLVQDPDEATVAAADLRSVGARAPTEAEIADCLFAWHVARHVKSNAIVYARGGATVGVGAGQMSRVYSARIAAIKAADAGLETVGAVMASDAFLPFRDGLDQAAEAGIRAVIQPGGSVRDEEVIAAADERGMAMLFTGTRHFLH